MDKKVAVVTGASRGIGRCISEHLLADGVIVCGLDFRVDVMNEWSKDQENFIGYDCDITNRERIAEIKADIISRFGSIDILVNNAGYLSPGRNDMEDFPEEYWDECVAVNLTGTFNMLKAFGKLMIETGKGGAIVNISSMGGLYPIPRSGAYCPTKAAIAMLTKVCALEWGKHHIRVNAICPGTILTDMNRSRLESDEIRIEREKVIPLGSIGNVEQIANTVDFLISEKANYITGETVLVDGGAVMEGIAINGKV
jgi:NAD(P)-dependent dehydrogenase (short-subunit alcohol dehydrogenase family)